MKHFLNIVNDKDEIIGEETRENIHARGLWHREVHVYFVTPNKEIIFQHRAKDKDMFPDLLDATVGGHVEIGLSYEETAVKETGEETGIKIRISDLIPVDKIKKSFKDEATGKINSVFNSRYLFVYRGNIDDLKVEEGKALGFEVWPIDKMSDISDSDRKKFIPYILKFVSVELREHIKKLKL